METNNTTKIAPLCPAGATAYLVSLEADSCYVTSRFIINTLIAGVICILGFIGNSVSFIVLKKDKQTPIASLLLQALAVADNIFLAFWFVHFSLRDLFRFGGLKPYRSYTWEHTKTYTYPFLYVGQTATIWLTVFIAFTRYFAVCWPYKASRICNVPTVRNGIIGICICSVLYNFPRFFEYKMTKNSVCKQKLYLPGRTFLTENDLYNLIYGDIMYYIFSFILPLVLLACLNIKLIIAYREVQQRRTALRGTRENGDNHRDPNITLVMIIVVLIFMVCNLPARVVQIIWRYDVPQYNCMLSHKYFITELSILLEVLNSSTNFIVYCVFRQQFRDILQNKLFRCWKARGSLPCADGNATQSLINGVTCKTLDTNCQVTHL